MTREPLSNQDLEHALAELPTWELQAGKLHRELEFQDFSAAFAFMTQAALVSERLNHHPEWSNVYNKLSIDLSTHDAGGITDSDIKWAKEVSRFLP